MRDLRRLSRPDTTVDIESGTGNETVELTGEKYYRASDVLHRASAPERDSSDRCLGGFIGCVGVVKRGSQD